MIVYSDPTIVFDCFLDSEMTTFVTHVASVFFKEEQNMLCPIFGGLIFFNQFCGLQRMSFTWGFQGKQGVIAFCGCVCPDEESSRSYEYIDLWNDVTCTLGCPDKFFEQCETVALWELPSHQPVPVTSQTSDTALSTTVSYGEFDTTSITVSYEEFATT